MLDSTQKPGEAPGGELELEGQIGRQMDKTLSSMPPNPVLPANADCFACSASCASAAATLRISAAAWSPPVAVILSGMFLPSAMGASGYRFGAISRMASRLTTVAPNRSAVAELRLM